jgi:hypothetical protein
VVLTFEWNGLRVGDKVLLHDWAAGLTLNPGVVAFVDTHLGVNDVGIRLLAGNRDRVVLWPSAGAVHRDPRDLTEPCWQCEALADRTGADRGLTLTR